MTPAPAAHVTLLHRTVYHYDHAVHLGPQWVRLRPRPDPRAPAAGFGLAVDPAPLSLHWMLDAAGNPVARFTLPGPVRRLSVEVTLGLDLAPRNPFDFVLDAAAANWPFRYQPPDAAILHPYLAAEPDPGPLTQALRDGGPAPDGLQDTVALILALAARTRDAVAYIVRMEPGVWPPERTLSEGRGSCRDSAWLLVQLLRLHGIAARFVSGYLVQPAEGPPPGSAELHAWAEAFLPGAGWIGIDATSGLLTAEGHIPVAAVAEPAAAAPMEGTVEPAEVRLETAITLSHPAAGQPAG